MSENKTDPIRIPLKERIFEEVRFIRTAFIMYYFVCISQIVEYTILVPIFCKVVNGYFCELPMYWITDCIVFSAAAVAVIIIIGSMKWTKDSMLTIWIPYLIANLCVYKFRFGIENILALLTVATTVRWFESMKHVIRRIKGEE